MKRSYDANQFFDPKQKKLNPSFFQSIRQKEISIALTFYFYSIGSDPYIFIIRNIKEKKKTSAIFAELVVEEKSRTDYGGENILIPTLFV